MAIEAKEIVQRYQEAKTIRGPYETDFRLAGMHCLPRSASGWNSTGPIMAPGGTRHSFDSTGARSLPKYVSILNRLVTPENQRWSTLTSNNASLNAIRAVQEYYAALNNLLFEKRYAPRSGFVQSVGEMYGAIGVYGTGPLSVTWRKPHGPDRGGFAYKAWPLRDIFILTDDNDRVDTVFRRFWLNARNFKRKFPNSPAPPCVAAELLKPSPAETAYFEFVQYLRPRDDFKPNALDVRRHPIASCYVCVNDQVEVGEEEGYASMPILTPRVFTEPGEVYGYSPAMQAMPALGGVSAQKKTMLKQGHKAVDPTILAHDDGILSGRMDMRPGAVNYGAIDAQGRKLVQALDTGANFNVAEAMIQDERKDIEDSFFVTLFQILTETPEMTATEVIERVAEKASLLAPTMGRLQTEFAGPCIEREIEILAEQGLLPDMPPELVEAKGEYQVIYTSPLAKGMHAEETSGFLRWRQMGYEHASATQDPSALDWINVDASMPALANHMSVPVQWVATEDQVKAKRDARAKQQEDAMVAQNAPAIASVATAAMKNGMPTQ